MSWLSDASSSYDALHIASVHQGLGITHKRYMHSREEEGAAVGLCAVLHEYSAQRRAERASNPRDGSSLPEVVAADGALEAGPD